MAKKNKITKLAEKLKQEDIDKLGWRAVADWDYYVNEASKILNKK